MIIEQSITREQLNRFAESSVKVTPSTNASKLFTKLYRCGSKLSKVNELASAIEDALYDSTVSIATYNPETEQETRTRCIDSLMNAISSTLGVEYREENKVKGSNAVTDYHFDAPNNGLNTRFTIEAKKMTNRIFNSKNEVDSTKAAQCTRYAAINSNGHGYSVVLLTNGRNMALFMQGVVECKNIKNKGWQPLRDTSKPIMTLSCYSVSREACVVLAYVIFQTLNGNFNRLLECVRETYEDEVTKLEAEFKNRGVQVV